MTVYNINGLDTAQVQQADETRAKRMFIGLLSGFMGVDQNYTGEDGYIANAPNQFVIANPDGTYSVQGRNQSNLQGIASANTLGIPTVLLLLAGGLLLLKLAK